MIENIVIVLIVAILVWWGFLALGCLFLSGTPAPKPPKVLKPGEWEYKSEPDPHIKAMMEAYRQLPDPIAAERLRILREAGRL